MLWMQTLLIAIAFLGDNKCTITHLLFSGDDWDQNTYKATHRHLVDKQTVLAHYYTTWTVLNNCVYAQDSCNWQQALTLMVLIG